MKRLSMIMVCLFAMLAASIGLKAQEISILLRPGWNWIGYPYPETVDLENAFGDFEPMADDVIESFWGYSEYVAGYGWFGGIDELKPGWGYMYYSNRTEVVSLVFAGSTPQAQVQVTTSEPMLITGNSAMSGGNVTSSNGDYVTLIVRGICWSTHQDPTLNDNFIEVGNSMGSFTAPMTGLNISTTYYVRAYAVTPSGTVFGEQQSFTTRDGIPTLTTDSITNITGESATSGGNITDDGGLNITARGVCWSTSPNPTVSDNHTTDSTGTGNFSSSITGLEIITTYYVRAYATTNAGTAYGNEVSFTTDAFPTGAIDGKFTINSNGDQVYFSQGNLQYQASTNTWRFASNQYDYIGDANSNISQTYGGWIDLFGWGTSGYNHGAVCYQPWSTSQTDSDYYAYGSYTYNLYDQTGQADWGYNAISNGGNTANQWRTLAKPEWNYVFNARTTTSGIRYAKAQVNNVNGVILLPDDWSSSTYSLSNTNSSGASFSSNTLTASQWNTLEQAGAVFLPAAGLRGGTSSVINVGYGYYWSASYLNSYDAYYVYFDASYLSTDRNGYNRQFGSSVRVVCPAEN